VEHYPACLNEKRNVGLTVILSVNSSVKAKTHESFPLGLRGIEGVT